jgi:hypothetical protein
LGDGGRRIANSRPLGLCTKIVSQKQGNKSFWMRIGKMICVRKKAKKDN